jgi:hypothetical protein
MSQSSFGAALSRLWPSGDGQDCRLARRHRRGGACGVCEHGISTPLLIVHVMAQISHECGAGPEVAQSTVQHAGEHHANDSFRRSHSHWPAVTSANDATATWRGVMQFGGITKAGIHGFCCCDTAQHEFYHFRSQQVCV